MLGHGSILGLCAHVCNVRVNISASECDDLSMHTVNVSVKATKSQTVCVCFLSSLCVVKFMALNLDAYVCVCVGVCVYACVRVDTPAGVRRCSFPSVFLPSSVSRQDIGVQCVPLHHRSLFTASPHVRHVCKLLATSNRDGVIRNKCSKVQQLGPAFSKTSLPTILHRIVRPPFSPLQPRLARRHLHK